MGAATLSLWRATEVRYSGSDTDRPEEICRPGNRYVAAFISWTDRPTDLNVFLRFSVQGSFASVVLPTMYRDGQHLGLPHMFRN